MAKMKSDSPIARRIVRAFLEFLANVRLAPETDLEGLEVAKECLVNMFKVDNASPTDEFCGQELLVDFVESHQASGEANILQGMAYQGNCPTRKPFATGSRSFKDQFYRKFRDSLHDKDILAIDYQMLDGVLQQRKGHQLIHKAVDELEGSGCCEFNNYNVAESLKSQGDKAMGSNQTSNAIQLYTCALALHGDSATYYADRAAAFTEIGEYNEAFEDCLAAIHFDPKYWNAYNRLGAVYYALGKYSEAIEKGFKKALELNPDNASIKENIQMAVQKLGRGLREREHNQRDEDATN
ncbi:small glutamine-rich tetratricopeptide repeat-containing protein-like isoform X2 [Punica granatum]|uniref:Small glutamine-rich tetratricopeptide repeat-containing protein-like isoform X2 n=1 Tax=Punica granatum TaxID=22663 RepID=A0A6P8D0F0_PUNGR|nr:small glutamine-rich tetratricopeptide repeat-containing protein-like isoform X2 [Punica granatum]